MNDEWKLWIDSLQTVAFIYIVNIVSLVVVSYDYIKSLFLFTSIELICLFKDILVFKLFDSLY